MDLTITITIPDEAVDRFVDLLCGDREGTHCGNLLTSSCSANWLFGLEHRPGCWLVCDDESMDEAQRVWMLCTQDDEDIKRLMDKAQNGEPLPNHMYLMDRAAALRALEYSVQRWGVEAFLEGNICHDEAVQHALLGEVRYG